MVFFLAIGLAVYQVRLENERLSAELNAKTEWLQVQQELINETLESLAIKSFTDIDKVRETNRTQKIQLGIIEESLSPENTRWAKIKQVRKAITSVIKERNYKNTPNIKDLTILSSAVVDFSEEYDVPVSLVLGVITRESAFYVKAQSPAGAQGLMQIIPATAQEISQDVGRRHYNIFQIRHNIEFGAWYLRKMIDRFDGDVELAIRAYNCGPTCVEMVTSGEWESGYPTETIGYHEAVLMWMSRYEEMGV